MVRWTACWRARLGLRNRPGRPGDATADGQRFVMVKAAGQEGAAATQINVVLNWFEELKKRVPAGR